MEEFPEECVYRHNQIEKTYLPGWFDLSVPQTHYFAHWQNWREQSFGLQLHNETVIQQLDAFKSSKLRPVILIMNIQYLDD